jgi:hypothetical protein
LLQEQPICLGVSKIERQVVPSSTQKVQMPPKKSPKKPRKSKAKTTVPLKAADIEWFSKVSTKAENDMANKVREQILEALSSSDCAFVNDSTHGPAWKRLQEKLDTAILQIVRRTGEPLSSLDSYTFKRKAGRSNNYDFLLTAKFTNKKTRQIKVEFKYNEQNLCAIPEFLNPSENKGFCNQSYAEFFYDTYLNKVIAIYPNLQPLKPTKEQYMQTIYQNTYAKHAFYESLKEEEATDALKKKEKRAIVLESITAFLEQTKDSYDLVKLSAEFKRTQEDKVFLFYCDGAFHLDSFVSDELEVDSVHSIKNGNTLVIQSKCPTTRYNMLLRWKNHLGILFPAWQIAVTRKA